MPRISALLEEARRGGILAQVALGREARSRLKDPGGRAELFELLRGARPSTWITLDDSMRAFGFDAEERPRKDRWLRALGIRATRPDATGILSSGFASMQRDGYEREAAVGRLATAADPLAGPFLALRTTDWVEPVARLASAILAQRMRDEAPLFLAAAPLVLVLSGRRRRSGLEGLVLERAAADADLRAALLGSAERKTRRRILSEPAVRGACTDEELRRIAFLDPDPVLASAAGLELVARSARREVGVDGLEPLLVGPARLRRAVLDALPAGAAVAERYLFDRSPTVREAAQRAVRRSGHDPTRFYRAALERSERVPLAITELARLGDPTDHAALLAALRSTDVGARRAAVAATRWIPGAASCERLAPLLRDPSAGVTREAERRLRSRADELEGAGLFALAEAPLAHQRRAAYRLLRRRSAPERIEADLLALTDGEASLRQEALSDLLTWLEFQSATAPRGDRTTRQRLSQRFTAVEHRLTERDAAQLRFHAGLRPEDLEGER